MPHVEASLDQKHGKQYDGESQVGLGGRVPERLPGDEYKNAGYEQDGTKAFEEVSHDGFEAVCRRRRGRVSAIALEPVLDLVVGQAVFE